MRDELIIVANVRGNIMMLSEYKVYIVVCLFVCLFVYRTRPNLVSEND